MFVCSNSAICAQARYDDGEPVKTICSRACMRRPEEGLLYALVAKNVAARSWNVLCILYSIFVTDRIWCQTVIFLHIRKQIAFSVVLPDPD